MRHLIPALFLSALVVGCPQPAEGPTGAVTATQGPPAQQGVAPPNAPSGAMPPPNIGSSDQMTPPPGLDSVPADQLQAAIGALNEDSLVIKASVLDYVAKNGKNGSLTFDNGDGGTVTAQYVRTHDPVRYKSDKGYIALSDFQAPGADPAAFYQLAFWLKKTGETFSVAEVDLQAFPAKRGGEWVRMELFTVNDTYAKPLQ
jgi:hypothetical protein